MTKEYVGTVAYVNISNERGNYTGVQPSTQWHIPDLNHFPNIFLSFRFNPENARNDITLYATLAGKNG